MLRFGPTEEGIPPHPRREPRLPGPLTGAALEAAFRDCADFSGRPVLIGGDPAKSASAWFLQGQVRTERMNDYILRPLALSARLREAGREEAVEQILTGAVYSQTCALCRTLDEAALALVDGAVVLDFPGDGRMLVFPVPTEEKRSVAPPEDEPSVMGAKDAFVESLRTNTSLVRRRLRAPELKIAETVAGRQSLTPVDVLWLEGIADPALADRVRRQAAAIDTDGILEPASLEEQLTGQARTAFPLLVRTQRPDRFCAGLLEGRVGILADGLPLGWLLPGTVGEFLRTGQDRSQNWAAASALSLLRYACMLLSLFLPAVYVAAVNFHPEMLPARLARSVSQARADVPFSSVFEVLILLLAFEVLQEAGLRLPGPVGQTVSILGGLVVGSAAVEARIVSPVVLIVVALAGVAGYTMPSQAFSNALRLWRFALTAAGSLGGLFAVTGLACVLLGRLSRLESFGVPYLAPFAAGDRQRRRGYGVLRWPAPRVKLRPGILHPRNVRRQG